MAAADPAPGANAAGRLPALALTKHSSVNAGWDSPCSERLIAVLKTYPR